MKITSRVEALENGYPRYFTGKPCRNGHLSERFTCNHTCVECGREICKRAYVKQSDKIKQKEKRKYNENREQKKQYQREYRAKPENRIKINTRHKNRYRTDSNYKLSCVIRGCLNKLIYRYLDGNRSNVSIRKLGYSIDEFKNHMESLFRPGMTWENHGEWHIDHIIPISILVEWGITDSKIINSLSNLQPLWASENTSKGARYIG